MSDTKSIEVKVFLHINGDFLETAIMVSFLCDGEIISRTWHGHTMELMSDDWVEYFL